MSSGTISAKRDLAHALQISNTHNGNVMVVKLEMYMAN